MSAFDVLARDEPERERMENALDARLFPIEDDSESWDAGIAEAAKTDPFAFGELYEAYYPRVYRYTYHRVGHPSDAEDITALVFMKALEALPTYHSRRSTFAPWLFRIARNAIIDHYRRRKSSSSLDEVDGHRDDSDPAAYALQREQSREMMTLVGHLSEEQREVVLLKFAGDLSYPEISAILGKNEPAVRMLLHRGLRKLKAVIEDA